MLMMPLHINQKSDYYDDEYHIIVNSQQILSALSSAGVLVNFIFTAFLLCLVLVNTES